MKLFYIVSFLVAIGASASELIPAKRMPQSLDTRAPFYGGWPIAASTCPGNTTSCGGGDGSCCPTSSDCYTEGLAGVAVCCPNTSNCVNTVNTLPVCADSSWTLYIGNYYYFCCAPGQVGILPNKGSSVAAGLCVDSSVSPAASVLATAYQAASATAATSASTTPSTSTSPTTTTSPTSTGSTNKPSTTSNSSPASVSLSMTATSSSTSSASQPSISTHSSTSKTGAIAGGVVGGVAVLILIALAIWFFVFKRQKKRATTPTETYYPTGPAEKDGTPQDPVRYEIPGQMAGNFGRSEVAATDVPPGKESGFKSATMPLTELA